MKRPPRNSLPLFIVLSVVIHVAACELFLRLQDSGEHLRQEAIALIPVIREALKPLPKPAPKPEVKRKRRPTPAPKNGSALARFRPTVETKRGPERSPAPKPQPKPRPRPEPQPKVAPKPRTTPLPSVRPKARPKPKPRPTSPTRPVRRPQPRKTRPAPKTPVKPMTPGQHDAFRRQLLAHFEPQWQVIPDLVVAAGPKLQRAVHRFFGMQLIAYPRGVEHPSYAILIDEEAGEYQFTREFDFKRYSNRVKDRSDVEGYARLIKRAKSRLALPEELAIVSLIPAKVDLYFAAKQMMAVRVAGLKPEDVIRTEGRYGLDARGRYCLVIERLITRNGDIIPVNDPERGAVKLL